jgi:hypothetical protein
MKTKDELNWLSGVIHEAQLHTYMRLAKKCLGLLINFNVILLRDGIKRHVINFPQ